MDPILERYQALEDKIKEYNPALDAQRLFRAFTYADNAHAGQLRKDGSPYITHPWQWRRLWRSWSWIPTPSSPPCSTTASRTPGPPTRRSPSSSAPRWPIWWRGHQADPGAVHLQGRGADGEPAQDAHGHGQGHPGDPHQNLRPAAQHAHHGVPERPQAEGEGPGNHGDLCAHRPPPGHAAHQVGAGGHLPAIPGSHRLQGDCRRAGRPLLRP